MFSTVIAVLLLAAAVYVVAMNWASAYVSLRNLRRRIDKHVSMAPLVPQVLVGLAWLIHEPGAMPWFPAPGFLVVALADLSLWWLLWLPVELVRRARSANKLKDL